MKIFVSACLAALMFVACSKMNDSANSAPPGQTRFSVYLTDDPASYEKVVLNIESVQVHYSDSTRDTWYTLKKFNPGYYDLLKFSNGKDTLLATDWVSAKDIDQIRLVLGDSSYVVVDGGTRYPLETPSGQESGIKLNVNATLTEGIEYQIWTDFDAEKSIVVTGNGKYILQPVIRVYTKALTGSVTGVVLPPAANAWVYILNGADTVASALPDSTSGMFMVNGLTEGNYTVAVDANNNYIDQNFTDVHVTTGNVTDIGTVNLHQ